MIMCSLTTTVLVLGLPLLAGAWILAPTTLPSTSRLSSSSLYVTNSDKDRAMVEFMNRVVEDSTPASTVLDGDTMDLVEKIVKAADDRKADDIVALNVEGCTTLCSALVILSGNSRPQNQAICKSIQDATSHIEPQILPEGTADSGWMLLDFGNVMVHIMTPKSRLYYNVEGQWVDKGGEYVNLDRILVPNTAAAMSGSTMEHLSEQDDPFWS